MKIEYKSLSFKAAAKDGLGDNEFAGYASTFLGPVDSYGDIIQKGAFKGSLDFFLNSGMILWQHSERSPIGKPIAATEDDTGLFLKGRISLTTLGNDCLILMRDEVIRKMSIGFVTEGYEMLSEERGKEILGEEGYNAAIRALPWWVDGLRLLTQIKLYEVSPVTWPANEDAAIAAVKSSPFSSIAAKIDTERRFEEFLRDAGYSHKEAKTIASHGFKAVRLALGTSAAEERTTKDQIPSDVADAMKELLATLRA